MLLIRAAAVSDAPLLLRFSREFAAYEHQPDAVVIKEETLIRDGFGSQPKFRSLIAEWDGEAIGYALFFGFYSSLKGSGIFLEDLTLVTIPSVFEINNIERRARVRSAITLPPCSTCFSSGS